jgi:hypothetical protein
MRHTIRGVGFATVCIVGVVLMACGSSDTTTGPGGSSTTFVSPKHQGPPTRPADLVGTIAVVTPFEPVTENCTPPDQLDPDGVVSSDDPPICSDPAMGIEGSILVEAPPDGAVGGLGDRASLTVRRDETAIWVCGPTGQVAEGSFGDLSNGATVSVWVDGPVAESYPVQATATALAVGPTCA